MAQQSRYACRYCGKPIIFSEEFKTDSGKFIPLGIPSHRPHRCKSKPFNKYTRRAWWWKQQEQSYKQRDQNKRKVDVYIIFDKEEEYRKILGIPLNATEKQIRDAWRQKCLQFHPDRNQGNEEWTTREMQKINEAYERVQLNAD